MKIAIAGYGVEGQENYAYWAADPQNQLTIVDERETLSDYPEGASTLLGENALSNLDGFDLVVRTAGLAPHKIQTNGRVWSATNEFFAKCPAFIIGVTGSKGKGTTSSLIASILEAAGKKVWLVGNIGVPALSVLSKIEPEDIVVYELSSFQLWDIQKSPQVAVVLFIEQEHLDVHASMEEYVEAKAQITRWQTDDDVLVYNSENEYSALIAGSSNARKVGYPSFETAHVNGDSFYYGDDNPICSVHDLKIPGEHNRSNALAAIDAIWQFTQDKDAIKRGLNNFNGLAHRLAYVDTVDDVSYYDDSIATTPTSAVAALRAFPDRSKVIILGGSYKGSDFTQVAQELLRHDVRAVLIGDEATRIAEACDAAGFAKYEIINNATAETFTARAAALSQPGGVVLLSPSAASFGLFKNYADRGDQFIEAVKNLKK